MYCKNISLYLVVVPNANETIKSFQTMSILDMSTDIYICILG